MATKTKVKTEDPHAHLKGAKVSEEMTATKDFCVYVETTEGELHLIDTRNVSEEILATIKGLE